MRRVRRFARFWYDFVVGDDWRLATGSAAALGLSGLLAPTDIPAWCITPVAVVALLAVIVLRSRPRTPAPS